METGETKPGAWRQLVLGRAERLRARQTLDGAKPRYEVDAWLAEAEYIARGRSGVVGWWSGSNIEAAWLPLRLAEEAIVLDLPDDEAHVRPAAHLALHNARDHLPADYSLAKALKNELDGSEAKNWKLIRGQVYNLTVAAHEARDAQFQLLRTFRNQLVALTWILTTLAVLAVLAAALAPPTVVEGLLPAPPGLTDWGAVLFAMAMGCIGALFSAVPSLAQAPTLEATFNPIRVQAGLKVVVGAWSAVVGLIVVAASMSGVADSGVDRVAQAGSLSQYAVMAALFGASQEALTRFADHRATNVSP